MAVCSMSSPTLLVLHYPHVMNVLEMWAKKEGVKMSETYEEFMTRLRRVMKDDYVAVNQQANPISIGLQELDLDRSQHIIEQYSHFPRAIVSLLYNARTAARDKNWHDLDVELTRNLGEELGTETFGVPHSEMLLKGLETALGMRSVREAKVGLATDRFVSSMQAVFAVKGSVAYVAGAAYALEASAVPELEIVWKVIEHFVSLRGNMGDGYDELVKFFDIHLGVWEPGHEDGLRKACQAHTATDAEARKQFEEGFRDVLAAMDLWWRELAVEGGSTLKELQASR